MSVYWLVLKTDFITAFRVRADWLHPIATFLLFVFLLSFILSERDHAMQFTGAGSLWLLAMLTNLLAIENLFGRDQQSGLIAQYLMHGKPVFLVVLARITSRWLLVGTPVCLLSALAAWLLGLTPTVILPLVATLSIAMPAMIAIGIFGAALSVGLERSSVLLAMLVLPLYLPMFLLGIGICHASLSETFTWGPLFWLIAIASATLTLSPFASSFALKISQEY